VHVFTHFKQPVLSEKQFWMHPGHTGIWELNVIGQINIGKKCSKRQKRNLGTCNFPLKSFGFSPHWNEFLNPLFLLLNLIYIFFELYMSKRILWSKLFMLSLNRSENFYLFHFHFIHNLYHNILFDQLLIIYTYIFYKKF
jgi:hypothetical protein